MSMAHAHLALNHLPILGTAFGLLLLVFGISRRSDEVKKISLVVFVLSALGAMFAYLTGEPASDQLHRVAGVSKALIERHEAAAKWSLLITEALGIGAIAGLAVRRWKPVYSGTAMAGVLALSVVAGGSLIRTANLGGQIRHSEIRATNQPLSTDEDIPGAPAPAEHEGHDED